MLCQFRPPPALYEREHFPTTLLDVKIFGHLQGVKWHLIVVLIFIPLIAQETEDLFKWLLVIQPSSENYPFIHLLTKDISTL